jgi:uncharacterized RDD family membrane protein YckC
MATCPSCGGAVQENYVHCPACGAALPPPIPADAPVPEAGDTAAPEVALPPVVEPAAEPAAVILPSQAGDTGYASLGDRMLEVCLDALVLLAVFWMMGMWVAPRYGGLTADGFNLEGAPALITGALTVLPFFLYYLCLEWWLGTTLGKIVVGVKVVGVDGGRIDLRASLIRNLLRLVDGLGVYLVAAVAVLVTRRCQRLGDLAAHTVVVRHDYPRFGRAIALLALLALPVAAIAGTWSLRGSQAAGTTAAVTTSGSSSSSTGAGASAGAGGQTAGSVALALGDVADGPFLVTGLRFAAGENGPERPNATFKSGETPTLLFEVKGFASDPAQKGRVRLTVAGRDASDVPINEPRETEVQPPATAASLNSWANVSLPNYVEPGNYRLEVTVADLVGNRKVVVSAPFKVEGQPFQPSASLALRGLRLTEGEDGPPRSETVYDKGGTVWMAFDVVGFRTGGDKTIRVQEHMTVTTASGAKALDAQVLDVNRQFFYVPRRLPITNHITLGQMPPGEYQVALTVTDEVGSQRCEEVVRFTIR